MSARLEFAARSDVGITRAGNEDRFLARPPLFAVADGMGGHQAGEVASELAIGLLEATADQSPMPDPDVVVAALERSNTAIRNEARLRSDLAGMGTTCTVLVVDEAVSIAHVGDSRAYRFRDGRLEQLTEDHSLVASMVREGIIDPADAMTDGRRNIITRALGADDQVRVDLVTADRLAGDRLLLCSDGLHSQVDDAAIGGVLRDEADPGRAVDQLIGMANAAGGEDNVTVILVDVGESEAEVEAALEPEAAVDAVAADADPVAPAWPAPDAVTSDEVDTLVDAPGASGAAAVAASPEPVAQPRRRSGRSPLVFILVLILAALALAVAGWLLAGFTAPA